MKFITDHSFFWLIPIFFLSLGLTFLIYQNKGWVKELKTNQRLTLRVLRFSSLFLILFLLLGIILQATNYREEKPVFISLVDNSSSMLNYKDSSIIKGQIQNFKKELSEKFKDRFELIELNVGTIVSNDPLKFNENTSALELGFEKINIDYYNRNIGGIAFISDGNYNVGANPSYAAEKISLTPIFTLTVGDTIPKKDHFIKHITANDIAFLNNEFPVEVDIEAFKIGKRNANISIYKNGQKIASQALKYESGKYDFTEANFILKADNIGFQTYTVKLEAINGEYTLKNNQRSFYVEVIDSRNKVLLLSGAPHPDISALKSVLDEYEGSEVITSLYSEWNKSLDKVDLIIWHEPGINFDQNTLQLIKQKNIPIFFIIGPNTSSGTISKLNIGITVAAGNQTDENQAVISKSFSAFELSDKTVEAIDFFPPLTCKFGTISINGSNEVLLNQRIGSITKKEPLLFFLNQNNAKFGVLYGEGLWRWRINNHLRNSNQEAFNEFFSKITNYLLVKQQGAGLRIEFPKRFTIDEEVLVNASFYNSSLEPITTPKISIEITDQKGKKYKSQFGLVGTSYKLALGKLKSGNYSWSAKTTFNGKSYSKKGNFLVEDIQIEKTESNANQGVMKQLSKQSNGKFNLLKDYKKTIEDISNRKDITTISYAETSFEDLIEYIVIFILIFMLLSGEWFLRRWYGSY
jgi:hypothetical protein